MAGQAPVNPHQKGDIGFDQSELTNSSVYALSRVSDSSFKISKILWLLIFMACLSGGIYKIQKFYFLYHQYPIVVDFRTYQKKSLEFPAVSICNLNRFKSRQRECSTTPIFVQDNETGTPLLFSERRSLHYCNSGNGAQSKEDTNYQNLKFMKEYYEKDEMTRLMMGHFPMAMIRHCSFNGKKCSWFDLDYITNYRFGNCLLFNRQNKGKKALRIEETGVGEGLLLDLNLQAFDYLNITETVGAKIIIHDPRYNPSPEEEGFYVSPGFETLVSLKQKYVSRLSTPYRDRCINYEKQPDSSMLNKYQCIRKCIQEQNYAKCGCTDQTLDSMSNLKSCDILNKTHACCLDAVVDGMALSGPTCDCPLPCRSVIYKEEISRSRLPLKRMEYLIMQDGSKCRINQGLLRLNIFYSSLERLEYKQRPMWQIEELLSYFGNELGLWLGMSFMIFFDMTEKLIILGRIMLKNSGW
ncbi:Acid-sensing ion channel 4-A like protein [Argiope bruennichi]|uniref:Acid-sensing ion channel 4-A like protein n=1 Tax=Argiope bruennichi TaxID=94029 RepID=A0A8T0FRU3_ARGBR|nr:Acid-sensing ion channel 4-A like protein [Argiope bruennichi]